MFGVDLKDRWGLKQFAHEDVWLERSSSTSGVQSAVSWEINHVAKCIRTDSKNIMLTTWIQWLWAQHEMCKESFAEKNEKKLKRSDSTGQLNMSPMSIVYTYALQSTCICNFGIIICIYCDFYLFFHLTWQLVNRLESKICKLSLMCLDPPQAFERFFSVFFPLLDFSLFPLCPALSSVH